MARFNYYDDMTLEELKKEKEALMDYLETYERVLADPYASSEQKSEILNSDKKYDSERLEYVESIISSKEKK